MCFHCVVTGEWKMLTDAVSSLGGGGGATARENRTALLVCGTPKFTKATAVEADETLGEHSDVYSKSLISLFSLAVALSGGLLFSISRPPCLPF